MYNFNNKETQLKMSKDVSGHFSEKHIQGNRYMTNHSMSLTIGVMQITSIMRSYLMHLKQLLLALEKGLIHEEDAGSVPSIHMTGHNSCSRRFNALLKPQQLAEHT